MKNREYYNSLFDIYQELLTKVEKSTFMDYYQEDLSLSEIADNREISKSSVGKTLKQAEEKLEELESILKMYHLKKELNDLLEINDIEEIKEKLEKLI